MLTIPIQPTPSQTITVSLANQQCTINVYQKSTGLYVDLFVNNSLIIGGVIAQNLNRIVRSAYLGFIGDLGFWDTQSVLQADGTMLGSDPDYTGLRSQFQLIYLEAADL